jgi:hypothetical protein
MIPTLYLLYALVQGILVARYILEEKDAPVGAVILLTIFAPLVSVFVVGGAFFEAIKWLVTYRPKKK